MLAAAPASRLRPLTGLPRPFLTFLAGLTVSKLGDSLHAFALPWIAYELTRSPLVMGTLYATEIIPILLLGAFAGVLVDRFDRRRLMMGADLLRAAIVALLPILHLAGMLALWHLYAAAFALSLVSLAFDVATTTVIPEVAGSDLTRANAAHQVAMQAASMAGPALAGIAIATLGGFNTLWLNAASFGGTFLALLSLPALSRATGAASVAGVLAGIGEGFRWLWGNRAIRVLSLQAATGNFGFGMVAAVLMFYLRSTLGLSAEVAGLDYAMLGVGGVLGGVAIVPLSRRYRRGSLYPALLAFGMGGLLLMALLRTWWAPGLGFGMVSACNVAWVVLSTSVRQELIPRELMGRVLSFSRILSTAAMPLGATLAGVLSGVTSPTVVFLIAAGTKGVEVLIARYSAMRDL
ncbi:MAG TPA: MFS transporter [Deinococcales bacterium]|nr:MFS transporter [Deinococcales bacterium]